MTRKRNNRKNKSEKEVDSIGPSRTEIFIVRSVLLGGLGLITVLSLQPWLGISSVLVDSITVVPFYDVLTTIPYVSNVVQYLDNVGDSLFSGIVGITIAATINYYQVRGGLSVSRRDWVLRTLAGCIEIIVCVHHHAPYDGGFEALALDFPRLDFYSFDLVATVFTIANVILFEVVFLCGFDYVNRLEGERLNVRDREHEAAAV